MKPSRSVNPIEIFTGVKNGPDFMSSSVVQMDYLPVSRIEDSSPPIIKQSETQMAQSSLNTFIVGSVATEIAKTIIGDLMESITDRVIIDKHSKVRGNEVTFRDLTRISKDVKKTKNGSKRLQLQKKVTEFFKRKSDNPIVESAKRKNAVQK